MAEQNIETNTVGVDVLDASCPDIKIFNRNKENATLSKEEESSSQAAKLQELSDLYYDMSGNKYLYIINHFKYQQREDGTKPNDRMGTCKDVKRLQSSFSGLGFQVKTYQDLDHEAIIDVLHGIITSDHKQTSCIAVAVLTHGDWGGVLEAADMQYALSEIHDKFVYSHNPHLTHKPKLFFIQACRGEELDSGKLATDGYNNTGNSFILPTHVDFLTLYSTCPDHVSWRESRGSWLIQALCNAVDAYSKELDLLQIITRVNAEVAMRTSFNQNKLHHNKKQASETHFTLTKLLKF